MLSINIVCIGKLKEKYWKDACQEYSKRLNGLCKFSIIELSESRLPDNPSEAQINSVLENEGDRILSVSTNHCALIPLCIEGKIYSSEQLAHYINELALNGYSTINFIIGSSFGLSNHVKQLGVTKLSMSKMTFPHQLARVMLCEQVYRSFQINNNTKYHK